jgi:hypothetical protein
VPGSDCSAAKGGFALDRQGWTASTNAPSSSSDAPANALDGNFSSRFSTNEDQVAGLYLKVDLGRAQAFDEVVLSSPNSPSDYARAFDVQVSADGSHWSTVASCTGGSASEVVSFSPQSARYFQVVLTGADAKYWWSVDELDLYNPAGKAPAITSAATETALVGRYGTFTVVASGTPTPTLTESGALPSGLSFRANPDGTATIAGTPSAGGSYSLTITAANGVGSPAVQHLALVVDASPAITSAGSFSVLPGRYGSFTITATGTPTPVLSESGALAPGLAFKANGNGTATIAGTPPVGTRGTYRVAITASNGTGNAAVQDLGITVAPSATVTSVAASANPATVGQDVTYTAKVSPVPDGGTVRFYADGAPIAACSAVPVSTTTGEATCTTAFGTATSIGLQADYSGHDPFAPSTSATYTEVVKAPPAGYWLATANGQVYNIGAAPSLGGVTTSATTGPVVGIAATATGKGYWVVTANGTVDALGDARYYGDLPGLGKHVTDIVAIAPTTDGQGYYLVGADGGFFTFGDAKFHGSLPGIHLHVKDIVGMVASPGGAGYLLVGADGGVFSFGASRFYGSLPGLGLHVHDIRAILPSATAKGYILVGADGGAFTFGSGVRFHGSLPGEHISTNDIVGIALTPDDGGYYMAGADGRVFAFGDATNMATPASLASNLPVAGIATT